LLHIVNGDATAARLAPAALPGEVLVWRDILVEGPVEPGLAIDALAAMRAPWLSRRLRIDGKAYAANGRAEADGLARAIEHDEIVLWFEQDLFCVANLCHLAAWLGRGRAPARVSLLFPPEPLGTTATAALSALFTARRPFTAEAVTQAAAWWQAYAGQDPRALEAIGPGPLPFLDTAARLHLARFPSIATGLGAVEAAALHALDDSPRALADVFLASTRDARIRAHGMTDLQLAAHLHALADGPTPLVHVAGDAVAITADGRAVRDGAGDRLDAQPLDWWLGGVPLRGRRVAWRWDETRARVVTIR
jgi:hypothetical protein